MIETEMFGLIYQSYFRHASQFVLIISVAFGIDLDVKSDFFSIHFLYNKCNK